MKKALIATAAIAALSFSSQSQAGDEALWAIGGFILGGVIAGQQQGYYPPSYPPVVVSPPRFITRCYDYVVYDAYNRPIFRRECFQQPVY